MEAIENIRARLRGHPQAELINVCASIIDQEQRLHESALTTLSRYVALVSEQYATIQELRAEIAELRSRKQP